MGIPNRALSSGSATIWLGRSRAPSNDARLSAHPLATHAALVTGTEGSSTLISTSVSHASREFERLELRGWPRHAHLVQRSGLWHPIASSQAPAYPDEARDALAAVEDASYWFRHRARAVERLARRARIEGAIWDVGAGNGSIALYLQQRGFEVVAVEPGLSGARKTLSRGVGTVIAGRLEDLALPTGSIGAIGVFDVLEHLGEPSLLLRELARVLAPGGALLVTVPAHPRLWSTADREAGHHRRYTRRSLDREVVGHGFTPRTAASLFHALVPAVYVGRVLGRRSASALPTADAAARVARQVGPRSRGMRAAASAVFAIERGIDRVVPLPFGASLLAAYERASPEPPDPARG